MQYADYVDPYVGTISPMLQTCEPRVMRPHGMAEIVPVYDRQWTDRYWAETLVGFSFFGGTIMADNDENGRFVSEFDHDLETMKCYGASMLLENSGITAEYTASRHAAVYRFTPAKTTLAVRVQAEEFEYENGTLTGRSIVRERAHCFAARFDRNPVKVEAFEDGIVFVFDGVVTVYAGFSLIDSAQALANAEKEVSGKTCEACAEEAKAEWNAALGRIEVTGGTEQERRTFYTALYRVMNRMVNITEYGRYRNPDTNDVTEDARNFYTVDAIWDTFRNAHPLKLLLSGKDQADEIDSYLRMYRDGGWLPSFPNVDGNHCVMFGKHAAQMITDAWMKGVRGFDAELALQAMLKNAEQATKIPWSDAPVNEYDTCYFEKGFCPAIGEGEEETNPHVTRSELRQSVSCTLEVSYDDWCVSQMAEALGKTEIAEKYAKRAKNYQNLYDASIGFFAPKDRDGNWIRPFDPYRSAGPGGRLYFGECNAFTYLFSVQHDIEGLIALLGGREKLAERLDTLFSEQYGCWKYTFLGQYPDSTGLIGQFCMGNEPSFHIPYLYNAAGQPWKTQRRVREIMRIWFDDTPKGICGDEDNGAMSAWYVFSAMGFYPTCPGKPVYDIGSPVFEQIKLHLDGGKTFTIRAENNLPENKYIHSALLNGERLTAPRLSHTDIAEGGVLELKMGNRPNKECFA